jgi:hypothetical protein
MATSPTDGHITSLLPNHIPRSHQLLATLADFGPKLTVTFLVYGHIPSLLVAYLTSGQIVDLSLQLLFHHDQKLTRLRIPCP